jgi:hypothetical protein
VSIAQLLSKEGLSLLENEIAVIREELNRTHQMLTNQQQPEPEGDEPGEMPMAA